MHGWRVSRGARRYRAALAVATAALGVVLIYSGSAPARSDPTPGPPEVRASGVAASAGSVSPTPTVSARVSTEATTAITTTAPVTFTFPVAGRTSYEHLHHDYPASDIMAPCGTTVVAVTAGLVLDTTTVDAFDPRINAGATRGGLSVSILGDDGVRYYGSHLSGIEAGIKPGVRVSGGQRLGKVGDTGSASACHLHFGISPPCQRVGDWWNQRGVIWPWRYLDSWRANGDASPAAEVLGWQAANGCPTQPTVYP